MRLLETEAMPEVVRRMSFHMAGHLELARTFLLEGGKVGGGDSTVIALHRKNMIKVRDLALKRDLADQAKLAEEIIGIIDQRYPNAKQELTKE